VRAWACTRCTAEAISGPTATASSRWRTARRAHPRWPPPARR
jgi:hypothetical protein